ncbi:hypothetical protein OWV82_019515 [Melia azedarach]|uniref:Uncharacterized protein n=1 Tax=Melia azedarach TaxID=155640 RepID=A0ACC1X397_MELAZ|nr:hypothetical protein OWV82_019515 [Melia azedarach]
MCAITCGGPSAFSHPFGMPGEAPPGSLEGMLLASEETSESSHNEELSPGGAPEPSPAKEIFPLYEGSPSEMSPGEAPAPSPSEEISPEEVPGSSLPETLSRKQGPLPDHFFFNLST